MGTLEHTIAVPLYALVLGIIAWLVTNIMVWVATGKRAGTILKGAKVESQAQKDEVVAHFDRELASLKRDGGEVNLKEEITAVQAHIQGIDDALGAKFEMWDQALAEMPGRVRLSIYGKEGAEAKALYRAAAEGEEEIEAYMAENMDASEIAMARVEAIEPPEDWKAKHPLGNMLVEGGKEWLRAKMDEARGVVTLKKVGSGNKFR